MKVPGFDLRHVESYSAAFAFYAFSALSCPIMYLKKKTVPFSQVFVLEFVSTS